MPMTLVVDGQCMGDSLPHGSEVRIEPRRFYWPGDIVVYGRGDGRLVSHRFLGYIRGRTGWLALTRADTARAADGPVKVDRVLGVLRQIGDEPVHADAETRLSAALRYLPAATRLIASRLSNRKTAGIQ